MADEGYGFRVIASRVAAVLVGIPAALFGVMLSLFVDTSTALDLAYMVAYVAVIYLVLGFIFGLVGPKTGVHWTPWLVTPGVLIAAWLTVTERIWLYGAAITLVCIGGALLGSWSGASIRLAFSERRSAGR